MKQSDQPWIYRLSSSIRSSIGSISFLGCVLLLMLLGWLFQEVWEKESFSFDTTTLLWIHQFANPFLDWLMLNITSLADPPMVIGIFVGTIFLLWRKRKYAEIKMFAIACIGGEALNIGLKLAFGKLRPQLWTQLISETSSSFPSGHALGSLVVYGFLAYFLATEFKRSALVMYGVACELILAIGFSRLYLGVHWLTDVIAGYSVGFLWLITCISILKHNLTRLELEKAE
jgi:membrane-associated phospholipid phosphatase